MNTNSQTGPKAQAEAQLIDQISDKIDRLVEVDYGDFKRKAAQYLLRLEEATAIRPSPETRKILAEAKKQILYSGKISIEDARTYILEKLQQLRRQFE